MWTQQSPRALLRNLPAPEPGSREPLTSQHRPQAQFCKVGVRLPANAQGASRGSKCRTGRLKRSRPVGIRTPSRSPSPRTSSHHTGPASSGALGSPRRGKHRQRACAVAHVAVGGDRDPEAMAGQPRLPAGANVTPRPHGRSEKDEATCADVPGAGPTRSRRLSRPPSSAWAARTPPPGPRRTGCTSSAGRARGSLSPRGSEKRTWRPRFR